MLQQHAVLDRDVVEGGQSQHKSGEVLGGHGAAGIYLGFVPGMVDVLKCFVSEAELTKSRLYLSVECVDT